MMTLIIFTITMTKRLNCMPTMLKQNKNVMYKHKPKKASLLMLKYLLKIRGKLHNYKKVG